MVCPFRLATRAPASRKISLTRYRNRGCECMASASLARLLKTLAEGTGLEPASTSGGGFQDRLRALTLPLPYAFTNINQGVQPSNCTRSGEVLDISVPS